MVAPVRRGRPPTVPSQDRAVRVPWSMPQWMIDRIREIADRRGVSYSEVAREFVERGLIEHDIRERMGSDRVPV